MGLLVEIVQPNPPVAHKESFESKKLAFGEVALALRSPVRGYPPGAPGVDRGTAQTFYLRREAPPRALSSLHSISF